MTPDLIKQLMAIRKEKKSRQEQGLCLIEGRKTVEDVSKQKPIIHLITTEPINIPAQETFVVPPYIIEKISGCVSPEGILATTALPPPVHLKEKNWILALDRIQDPGNLGTLIRTALAFAWEGIFLVEGGCDLFHEKVLRATKGASLFLPYQVGSREELLKLNLPLFCGDLEGSPPEKVSKAILVLGNEGQGVSPFFQEKCQKLTIPLEGQMDSLNVAVAGALLMAKLKGIV
jgi:TrmH family RNA methyltransferase